MQATDNGITSYSAKVTVNTSLDDPVDDGKHALGTTDPEEQVAVLEDVLPSFEMHNYMFNRTIYDTENISSLDRPPQYEDLSILDNLKKCENGHHPQLDANNFVDPTKNPNLLLLNNLEKFQKIDLPIHIQIVLTKLVPKLGVKSERENPLRQYKPGEVVCGYITIENKSKETIPFEMLLVSLEGELTIPHPSHPGELIRKKFMKTYDLSACFHYGCIDLKSQGVSWETRRDHIDESLIGFSNDRMIEPNIKHKKFFAFKLPHYLLDTSCFDQLPSHLKLPPSLGVDNYAFSGIAEHIKVNPFLGYGRLDRYGSPIKTSDYADSGQSVSYFVNVQVIGRKLDFYKKYYTHETKHEYDFIFLKNIEYHFRVDTSITPPNALTLTAGNYYGEISTSKQLKIIEKLVADELNEILERKNLNQIGISNQREQDEIIFSSLPSSKKSSQLFGSNDLLPLLTDTKTSLTDTEGFSRYSTINLVKDFFSKVDGDLSIRLSMMKNAQMKSLIPKQLRHANRKKNITSITSNPSSLSSLTELQSSNQINFDNENIYVYLSFKGADAKRNTKSSLPSSISLTPNLKVYNIQSPYPIPITFDNKFIFNGGLDTNNVSNMKRKFLFYYQQLVDVLKELDLGLARTLYNKINSLARVNVTTQTIKKIFETHAIDISNQWKFNSAENIYECEFKIPLILDTKNPERSSVLSVPPSFQQCNLSRVYAIDVELSVKKAKSKINMCFPITVV